MDAAKLLLLWGKTDSTDQARYHPLLFHMLDVGFVAHALWHEAVPPVMRRRVAGALGLSEDDAGRVVALLAAQHDFGKASAFQMKAPSLWPQVASIGDNPDVGGTAHGHGTLTYVALPPVCSDGAGGWTGTPRAVKALAKITAGHHGAFPLAAQSVGPNEPGRAALGGPAWDEARRGLATQLSDLLFPDQAPLCLGAARLRDATLAPVVGGLISIADWIGSSTTHFPVAWPREPRGYALCSQRQAGEALAALHWTPALHWPAQTDFGAIFRTELGVPYEPNALQRAVARLARTASAPYLMVVEAAMGDGKTEAALYAADCALSAGLARGLYVALPTQATGDAMFRRVVDGYLCHRSGLGRLNLQLVHGGAALSKDFERLQQAALELDLRAVDEYAGGDTQDGGAVVAEAWFTAAKQALLAPLGVGTVDQALLSVLQTRHWFVRLHGLAGKVIVLDEVHAYDVYTSSLLCRLLAWLRQLGCSVILLSATLPAARRAELIGAWGAELPAVEQPYPRLTFATGDQAGSVGIEGWASRRSVRLTAIPCDLGGLGARLRADLPGGGCAAVICNTVGRAQEAFRTLRSELRPEGWLVLLVHARMPARWRATRERRILRLLGRSGRRPRRLVVVGTQVLEQSLDIDLDWMASDMAPVDLILQRMGRVWRHERQDRPAPEPRMAVMVDTGSDGLPIFPPGAERVYSRYVLLRSALALSSGLLQDAGLLDTEGRLRLPEAIAPVVSTVYSADALAPDDAWTEALAHAEAADVRLSERDRLKADRVLTPAPEASLDTVLEPGADGQATRTVLFDDEDPRVHPDVRVATRLGRPSVSVVCLGESAVGLAFGAPGMGVPDANEARTLAGWSVSISDPRLFCALVSQEPRPEWRRSRHLRHHREIVFIAGQACVGDCVVSLSRQEGLTVGRGRGGDTDAKPCDE